MTRKHSIWLFTALVFIIPLTAYGLLMLFENHVQKLPVLGPEKEVNGKTIKHRIGDFTLISHNNDPYNSARWHNKIVVTDFFFTRCPVICPKMTAGMKKIQERYSGDEQVLLNSITVDPEHDSPQILSQYKMKNEIGENWIFLTGDKKNIYKLARNSFLVTATDGNGGPGDFIHSEKLVLIDPDKRIRGYYDGTTTAEVDQLILDIKKLKNEF